MSAAAHCNHHSLGLITFNAFSKLDNRSVQTEQAHELEGRATTQEGCEKREKWGWLCICTGWGLLATEQLCRKDLGFPQQGKGVRSVQRKPTLYWVDNSNSAASKSREVTPSLITVKLHLEYCVHLWDLRTRKPLRIWVTAGEKKKIIKIAGMLEPIPTRRSQFHPAWRQEIAEGRRKFTEDRPRLPGRALLKIDRNIHKLEQWIDIMTGYRKHYSQSLGKLSIGAW